MDISKRSSIKRARRRICLVIALTLLLALSMASLAHADNIYVGREDGYVTWSLDCDTGELRIYADVSSAAPGWQGLSPNIRSVYIAPGVSTLPANAFLGCTAIKEVILPDTLTTVGAYAFADCRALLSVSLPATLQTVGEYAFRGCVNLTSVIYRGSSQAWDKLCIRASSVAGNEILTKLTPIYTLPTYTLTVHYVNDETGATLAPSTKHVVTVGSSCSVIPPTVSSFSPDRAMITLENARSDHSVTVRYHRTHCLVAVHYVDEDGRTVLPSEQLSVAYGTTVTLQAPRVPGYLLPDEPRASLTNVTRDETAYTFVYTLQQLSVTVRCLDEDDRPLCDPLLISNIPYGGAYYVMLPVFEGYTAEVSFLEGGSVIQSEEHTVRYVAKKHPVTLRFLDEQGNALSPDEVITTRHGTTFTWAPKIIDGYRATQEQLSIPAVREPQTLTVIYERAPYLLSVRHETENGTLLGESQSTVRFGEPFRCTAQEFDGYEVIPSSLAQAAGTMPASPLTVTLLYRTAESAPPPVSGGQEGPTDVPPSNDASGRDLLIPVAIGASLLVLVLGGGAVWLIKTKKHSTEQPPNE